MCCLKKKNNNQTSYKASFFVNVYFRLLSQNCSATRLVHDTDLQSINFQFVCIVEVIFVDHAL